MTEHLPSRATPGRDYIRLWLKCGYELHIREESAYMMPGHGEVYLADAWRVIADSTDLLVRRARSDYGRVTVASTRRVLGSTMHVAGKVTHYRKHELYRAA